MAESARSVDPRYFSTAQYNSDTPNAAKLQAADDTDETDFEYFSSRPQARTRIRAAFRGEFPRKLLKQGRGRPAVVIVAIERDATGQPTRRARGLVDGGRA